MIEMLALDHGRLISVDSGDRAQFFRVVAPSEPELLNLALLTGTSSELLSAACDPDERPRFEAEDEARLLVLRVPCDLQESSTPVKTVAFGVIVTRTQVITVCSRDSDVWTSLINSRSISYSDQAAPSFVFHLCMRVARLYLAKLNWIKTQADKVEQGIHKSMRNDMLIHLLELEKCLVDITTSLRAHDPLWDRLRRGWQRELSEQEEELLEDIRIEFKQARDLAEIHSGILSGMMDAFASIISNNLNVVMKLLTSITIIMMLPTLVASVYGMNVKLPFQDSQHAFLITMLLSFVASLLGVCVFWRKRFF
ncbi:MAG: magnesium transporter CorA family protein [Oligosphaeraceae bacterium]|nr:magnesium transporter CorA family protein [Oligosphaeraceae bacterium]